MLTIDQVKQASKCLSQDCDECALRGFSVNSCVEALARHAEKYDIYSGEAIRCSANCKSCNLDLYHQANDMEGCIEYLANAILDRTMQQIRDASKCSTQDCMKCSLNDLGENSHVCIEALNDYCTMFNVKLIVCHVGNNVSLIEHIANSILKEVDK